MSIISNKIRLIFFLPNFSFGGAGNSIFKLCKFLSNKNFSILVISLGKNGYKKNYQIASDTNIESIDKDGETQVIDINKASFKQLLDHRDKIHLKLSTEFYESDRGKETINNIEQIT